MKKVLNFIGNFFLFIILLPLNIFKYFNLFFYYVIKLLLRESPEKAEKRTGQRTISAHTGSHVYRRSAGNGS